MAQCNSFLFILLITYFFTCGTCLLVETFDTVNFTNPILRYTNGEECQNFRFGGLLQVVTSFTTDTCIMLYKEPNCKSYYIRVDPGQYADMTLVRHTSIDFVGAKSFVSCTSSGVYTGNQIHVELVGTALIIGDGSPPLKGMLNVYRDICYCLNVSTKGQYIGSITSVLNFGNCVMIYEQRDCQGKKYQLLGGVSPESEAIPDTYSFVIPGTSLGPCEPIPHCQALSVEVYKFFLTSRESLELVQNKSLNVPIGATTAFRNNRTEAALEVYEVNSTVEEIIEVNRISSFGHSSNYFSISDDVTFELIGPWTRDPESVKNAVTKAYHTSADSSGNGERFILKQEKPVSIRQLLDLPPCYEHVVESYVTIVKQIPVHYEFYAMVTGKTRYTSLSAAEIEERLTAGLVYVQDIDSNTIMVRGAGTLLVDYSLDPTAKGKGGQMDNCPSVMRTDGGVKVRETIK